MSWWIRGSVSVVSNRQIIDRVERQCNQALSGRRWRSFKGNRRGFYSLVLFTHLFIVSLGAELICNDKPLLVVYQGDYYVPMLRSYPETVFGGVFETETDYKDPFFQELIAEKGGEVFFHTGVVSV